MDGERKTRAAAQGYTARGASLEGRCRATGGHRRGNDDGMSAVEFVVLTPLLFLLLMLTVQFAMFMFARQAAQAAVQDGGRKAREEAASQGCLGPGTLDPAGWNSGLPWQQDAGNAVTARAQTLGGKLLDFSTLPNSGVTAGATYDPNSTAACKVSQVAVTFTADVPSLIPGWRLQVHVESHGPLEQFVGHP
jgi:hypothetical protein